jgi:hypothetical protein
MQIEEAYDDGFCDGQRSAIETLEILEHQVYRLDRKLADLKSKVYWWRVAAVIQSLILVAVLYRGMR